MKKKLLLTLSVIVLILAAIWSISSLNTMSISLRAGEISYVRICLNPYRYDTGDEFITLHMDDPEESGIIHWFITEFSGQYAFDSTDFFSGNSTGVWWESLCFYDKDGNLLQKISWRDVQYKGIYLTPNPNSSFTLLYKNDIDWAAFYDLFAQYKH